MLSARLRGLLGGRFGRLSEENARERLALKYAAFKRLVDANSAALEVMADMQAKASGDYLFDRAYVDQSFDRLAELTSGIVRDLQGLADGRHRALAGTVERVTAAARATAGETPTGPDGPAVLDLASMRGASPELVGGKVRRLGEIVCDVGLPVPDGFCVTTAACRAFLAETGLLGEVAEQIARVSLKDKEELEAASRSVKEMILDAAWPEAIARAILNAYDALDRRVGGGTPGSLRVSVRSSATGEDGEFTFAGQFDTVLNVSRGSLLRTCREVLASQFGPRALVYLRARGADGGVLPMAIGVIAMLDARASGVLYTRDPQDPESDSLIVAGVWGLGSPAVNGSADPDIFTVARDPEPALRETRVSAKRRMLLCREGAGLVEVDVPGWMRDQPCLSKDQVNLLGAYGKRLEEHFGRAQDVEWAVDANDALYILQSRPLRLSSRAKAEPGVMALRQGLVPLLSGGVVACRGCASGTVHVLAGDDEVQLVPAGAIVVARSASPRLAAALDRAAAMVTEVGSAASHLATVAREFGIPSIFGAAAATAVLRPGMVVTVDAELGNVYEGRIAALVDGAGAPAPVEETPLLRRFRASLAHVTPLNLTDPRSPGFKASRCRTIHDVLRFAHERAVEEMFTAGSLASRGTRHAAKLQSSLPVDFYFVDLGGGLAPRPEERTVTPDAFTCRPLRPLWRGMLQVPWRTDAAVGAAQIGSLLTSALTNRDALELARSPNFVIVSESYLNLSFRLGYHFSRVDAYLAERAEDSYASFLFHGGAADMAGRTRRVRFLAGALEAAGFGTHHREDALVARTGHAGAAEMERRLEELGRLLVVTRQADTLFGDEAEVDRALAAYRAGDFSLGLGPEGGTPS